MCAEGTASGRLLASLLALLAAPSALAQQDEHIFEPGKKHVCVPAASGQGWDCSSDQATPAAPEAQREPRLRSSSEVPAEPQRAEPDASSAAPVSTAAQAAPAASRPPPAVAAPPAAAQTTSAPDSGRARRVPSYLLAPGAQDSTPDAQPVADNPAPPPAAVRKPEPAPVRSEPAPTRSEPVAAQPAPAETPAPVTQTAAPAPAAPEPPRAVAESAPARQASAPAPAPGAPPPAAAATAVGAVPDAVAPTATAAAPAPVPPVPSEAAAPRAAAVSPLRGSDDFRRLADSRYVLELASGSDRGTVEASAGQAALPHGAVYLLALRRDGAPWYLAVWGDFESVDAARAARGQALAAGAAAGWPRRAGPLKQELRGEP